MAHSSLNLLHSWICYNEFSKNTFWEKYWKIRFRESNFESCFSKAHLMCLNVRQAFSLSICDYAFITHSLRFGTSAANFELGLFLFSFVFLRRVLSFSCHCCGL